MREQPVEQFYWSNARDKAERKTRVRIGIGIKIHVSNWTLRASFVLWLCIWNRSAVKENLKGLMLEYGPGDRQRFWEAANDENKIKKWKWTWDKIVEKKHRHLVGRQTRDFSEAFYIREVIEQKGLPSWISRNDNSTRHLSVDKEKKMSDEISAHYKKRKKEKKQNSRPFAQWSNCS